MIQKIRNSRLSKIIASYLAIQMIVSMVQPSNLYALTGGPSQPEFNSFTPIGTSDMVNLSTGDFNYNIPLMDVGGYPLNLAYDSGVGMDQEASWAGLGWNLNVGQITRDVRGIPDDFKGDEMIYTNNMRDNETVGLTFNINPQFLGYGDTGLGLSAGITVQHNNYTGIGFQPSAGISYTHNGQVSVGMSLSSSTASGATVSPSVSLSSKNISNNEKFNTGLNVGFGIGYNSRQGLTNFNMNSGMRISSLDKDSENKRGFKQGGAGSISFINNTFTPAKRVTYSNSSLSFAFSLGLDMWGIDGEVGVTGFGITQKIKGKVSSSKAYGYNNTHLAPSDAILDFNKEKENIISKNTLSLPVTNYTYDIYQIQGQGIGGMFRPFRGQVGKVFSQFVQDESDSGSFGGEFEGGAGWHVGLDVTLADGFSQTREWETPVASYFSESMAQENSWKYEEVYYKTIGEYTVDPEAHLFNSKLGGNKPIRIGIGGAPHAPGRYAENIYFAKKQHPSAPIGNHDYLPININEPIKREKRELRNTAVTPVNLGAAAHDPFINNNRTHSSAKTHHIAGYKILQSDGSTYLYGETVYNTSKVESTFAIKREPDRADEGTVDYFNNENSIGNRSGTDHYFSSIETPAYAHTYLLTGILSSDYEDLTGDGLSDDDLGSYTKFNYQTKAPNYNWSIPYKTGKASYNQGLNSDPDDDKASIVSGTKELKYIRTIETKTHIAYFRLGDRFDGKESGEGEQHMKKIDKIFLYTKPEFNRLLSDYGDDPDSITINLLSKRAIKVAHFDYDYSLCEEIPNNNVENDGKLTLKKLYFTYKDSYMGKHTPYKFNYEGLNPAYSFKAYDIWGNYKPNVANNYNVFQNPLSPQEFPFVQQVDRELQDEYASAWSLTSIDLPSGGRIDLTYETDDYQFVQNKKAMRMFKVAGVTKEGQIPGPSDLTGDKFLYKNGNYSNDAKYLIVELPENTELTPNLFEEKYLGEHIDKPIYFRFMLNMSKEAANPSNTSNDFDYVEGYFKIDTEIPGNSPFKMFSANGKFYAAIPMSFSRLEGGVNGGEFVNPISKAGWYFGQKYLSRKTYGLRPYTDPGSIINIINQLKADFGAIDEIIKGPNGKLRDQRLIAKRFIPEKSWIRLQEPSDRKLGGGARIRKIEMHDNWGQMLESTNGAYNQFYGQEYSYNLEDGSSAGVATYEPNMSKENPFVEPFYNKDESLVAPREVNYEEKPFGESFFPAPIVTYSRVEVKNLPRVKQDGEDTLRVKKHATGKVVTEFYTSKDFPTIADYTELDGPSNFYSNDQGLSSLLGLNIKVNNELTLSQGFAIQTNDMNGKEKGQSVYSELGEFISGVEYKYSVNSDGSLNNIVKTISDNGELKDHEIGVHYDVVNDFFENYTYSNMSGIQGNVVAIPIPMVPPLVVIIPTIVPQSATHKDILRTATTTKVIHRTGLMTEKIAYDLGATVSTENLAWDATTGKVLSTKTTNEYKDSYYNLDFPAYWVKEGMGLATNNIGIKGALQRNGFYYSIPGLSDLRKIFTPGDELIVRSFNLLPPSYTVDRLWVMGFNSQHNGVTLMNRNGEIAAQNPVLIFNIDRSGHRNMQHVSTASITLMKNPLTGSSINFADFDVTEVNNPRIVNASAVEFTDFWPSPCEANIPKNRFPRDQEGNEVYSIDDLCLNPYIYNIKGDYKPVRSYAYLTGRNVGAGLGVRNQGFFNEFALYYIYENDEWVKNEGPNAERWTYASEVTQYSPYGMELENRDALGRYSAAQYGYGYTLPVAVSSNSSYAEMGFDGFEDYDEGTTGSVESHFGFHDLPDIITSISNKHSHTGSKSIKVNPGTNLILRKNLEECAASESTSD